MSQRGVILIEYDVTKFSKNTALIVVHFFDAMCKFIKDTVTRITRDLCDTTTSFNAVI